MQKDIKHVSLIIQKVKTQDKVEIDAVFGTIDLGKKKISFTFMLDPKSPDKTNRAFAKSLIAMTDTAIAMDKAGAIKV